MPPVKVLKPSSPAGARGYKYAVPFLLENNGHIWPLLLVPPRSVVYLPTNSVEGYASIAQSPKAKTFSTPEAARKLLSWQPRYPPKDHSLRTGP